MYLYLVVGQSCYLLMSSTMELEIILIKEIFNLTFKIDQLYFNSNSS